MKTAMMKLSFGLATLFSLGTLVGCIQAAGIDESDGASEEVETAENTGEAAQALGIDYFRLRFKHTTDLEDPTCFEPVDTALSAPVVQRGCNTSAPSSTDSQSFYVWDPRDPNDPARADGRRMLKYAKGSNLCLMIAGYWAGSGALDNGAALVVYTCDAARLNQWFYLTDEQPDGYSAIRVDHSDRMLNVPGSSTDINALVYQYGNGTPNTAALIFRDPDANGNSPPPAW